MTAPTKRTLQLSASFKGMDFTLLGYMDEDYFMLAFDTHPDNLKRSEKKLTELPSVHQEDLKTKLNSQRADFSALGVTLPETSDLDSLFSHVSISDIWWIKGRKGNHNKSMFHFRLRFNLKDSLTISDGKYAIKFLSLEYASGKDIEESVRNDFKKKAKEVKAAVRGAQLMDEQLRKGQAAIANSEQSLAMGKEAIVQHEADQKNMQEALQRNAENERKTKAALENQVDMPSLMR